MSLSACNGALQIEIPGLENLQLEPLVEQSDDGPGSDPDEDLPAPPPPPQPLNLDNLESLQAAYIEIYEKVIPSVVSISSTRMVNGAGFGDLPDLPFEFDGPDQEFQFPSASSGSGFVWDTEGHIVTNNHVVEDGDVIRVNFFDGRSVVADLVGADADSDLAVLKVDLPAEELVPISVSDSTQIKVGQIAVAIGNPFNLQSSMTTGIVSGIGRSLSIGSADGSGLYYSIPDVIQTDTAINPGNSGGPLVDINGGLIGVTTAIESPVRANSGVGYVIPSVIVSKVVPLLIRDGQYLQPWIGISGFDLTPEYAQLMDLDPAQKGALVQEVQPNSPAEEAGLIGSTIEGEVDGIPVTFGGDVIVAADGDPIEDFEDLVAFLARETIVGQTITLTVLRDGETFDLDLTLKARPGSGTEDETLQPEEVGNGAWLGIAGVTINAELASSMELPEDTAGVLIQTITAESPADEAGLRGSYKPVEIDGQEVMVGGDVIIRVDRQAVTSIQELVDVINASEPGDEVSLSILRDGRTLRISVTLGEITP
jgi:S1-C subfamily serine protease